jgi:effector-binding domain-containing protein
MLMSEPKIKQTAPQTVAFITMRGSYDQTPAGYGRLYEWVTRRRLTPAGMPAAVYLTVPSAAPGVEAIWELWAPVAPDAEAAEPDESGVGIKQIQPMMVASVVYTGPYDGVGPTYEAMWAWIRANGYVPAGPPMEVYHSDPEDTPPEESVTEILMPVAPE